MSEKLFPKNFIREILKQKLDDYKMVMGNFGERIDLEFLRHTQKNIIYRSMILRSVKPGDRLPKSTIPPCLRWKEPAPDVEKTKGFVELAPARSCVDKRACRLAVVHESLLKWGFMHKVDDAFSLFCNKKIRTYYVSSFKIIPEKWYFCRPWRPRRKNQKRDLTDSYDLLNYPAA